MSWDALDGELQKVFPLLAVFEGRSFAADAVAYVVESEVFDVEDALYALEALSLVRAEGEARYWQHLLLADFACEKLVNTEDAYARFVDYYYGFVQVNVTNFDCLEPEWENIMAAIKSYADIFVICGYASSAFALQNFFSRRVHDNTIPILIPDMGNAIFKRLDLRVGWWNHVGAAEINITR